MFRQSPNSWILFHPLENSPNLKSCPRLKKRPNCAESLHLVILRQTSFVPSRLLLSNWMTRVIFLHHDKDESWLQNISNEMGFVAGWSSLGLNMSLRLCGGFESMPEGHFEHLWEKYSFFLDNHNLGAYFDFSKITLNYLKLPNYSLIIFDIVVNMIPKET